MRQIGSLQNLDTAEKFADFLRAEGVASSVDKAADGFRIWVHDDDRVAMAKEELPRFLADPNNQRYRDASNRAMTRMRQQAERLRQARQQTVNLSEKWSLPAGANCVMTFGLIAVSLVVAYFLGLNPKPDDPKLDLLSFSTDRTLRPIFRGEVWRLFTPIFLHFGIMHLVFNMLWLRQFGMQIESRLGTAKFFGMVLVIAALSNYGQFLFVGPAFGGMSGVVYGLFGYIWVKGKMEPGSGFDLPSQTITMMLVWHILCVIGIVPHVANWAHGVGLVTGITMGFAGTFLKPFIRRK